MDVKQAFRVGFLARCAEEGLSPEETEARAESFRKQAILGGIAKYPALAVLLAGAGGLGAGYAAGGLSKKKVDPADVRRQELIGTYNTYAEQAEMANQHAAAPTPAPRSPRP